MALIQLCLTAISHPKMRYFQKFLQASGTKAGIAFWLIFVMCAVEMGVNRTPVGRHVNAHGYVLLSELRRALGRGEAQKSLPVVVVDISGVQTAPDPETGVPYTPPDVIRRIIEQVTNQGQRPLAVGVDIDCSPYLQGLDARVPPGFFELMQTAVGLQAETVPVPVYFGVDRAMPYGPDNWLRERMWAGHAVWLRIPSDQEYAVPLGVYGGGVAWTPDENRVGDWLPSLSYAMGMAIADPRKTDDVPPRRPLVPPRPDGSPAIIQEREVEGTDLRVPLALSDLGLIEEVESRVVVVAPDGEIPYDHRLAFHNKLVFIGKVKGASDLLEAPGSDVAKPGVLFHVAGALTLRYQDLRVVPEWLGQGMGVVFALLLWLQVNPQVYCPSSAKSRETKPRAGSPTVLLGLLRRRRAPDGTVSEHLLEADDGRAPASEASIKESLDELLQDLREAVQGNLLWVLVATILAVVLLWFGWLWLDLLFVYAFALVELALEYVLAFRHARELRARCG